MRVHSPEEELATNQLADSIDPYDIAAAVVEAITTVWGEQFLTEPMVQELWRMTLRSLPDLAESLARWLPDPTP